MILIKLLTRLYILIYTINIKVLELQLRSLDKDDTTYQETICNLIKAYTKRYSCKTIIMARKITNKPKNKNQGVN